jgi:hypothetical protein
MSLRIRAALAGERSAETKRVARFRTVYRPAFAMAATAIIATVCFSLFHRAPSHPFHPVIVAVNPGNASQVEPPPSIDRRTAAEPASHAGRHGTAAPPHIKTRPIHEPGIERMAKIPAAGKATTIAVPVAPPGTKVAKTNSAAPRKTIAPKRDETVAHVPVEHGPSVPVEPIKPHDNESVATNKVPDTNPVTPAPQPLVTAPEPPPHITSEPPRTVIVASSGGGNSLMASVREHLDHMPRAISTQGARITHASGVHLADYTTAIEAGNQAESVSQTAGIVTADYK